MAIKAKAKTTLKMLNYADTTCSSGDKQWLIRPRKQLHTRQREVSITQALTQQRGGFKGLKNKHPNNSEY